MRAPEKTFRRAKELRQSLSRPEIKLWLCLSRGRLDGLHFRKQHPVGPYVLDFYCSALRLAIEIDGESHGYRDRPERDAFRDRWLAERDILTVRIPARAVLDDCDGVLRGIQEIARDRALAPSVASRHLPRERGRTRGGGRSG